MTSSAARRSGARRISALMPSTGCARPLEVGAPVGFVASHKGLGFAQEDDGRRCLSCSEGRVQRAGRCGTLSPTPTAAAHAGGRNVGHHADQGGQHGAVVVDATYQSRGLDASRGAGAARVAGDDEDSLEARGSTRIMSRTGMPRRCAGCPGRGRAALPWVRDILRPLGAGGVKEGRAMRWARGVVDRDGGLASYDDARFFGGGETTLTPGAADRFAEGGARCRRL